jgi:hypothetical protein
MARGAIALSLIIGGAVALVSQTTSALTRGGTNGAQQTSVQEPASDSQHLRDDIKALEHCCRGWLTAEQPFFSWHMITPGSVS